MTLWAPDDNTTLSLVGMFGASATSTQAALDTVVKTNGKTAFANTTARDAYYSGTVAEGSLAVILGTWPRLEMYLAGSWCFMGPSSYGARVTRASNTSIPNTATLTVISWSSTTFATGGFTTSTAGITVPLTGYYNITANCVWGVGAAAGYKDLRMLINGSASGTRMHRQAGASGHAQVGQFADNFVNFSAGDVISFGVAQTSGVTMTLGPAYFTMNYVGSIPGS